MSFFDLSSSNASAIYSQEIDGKILIESSGFINCKSKGQASTVILYYKESVISDICANNCSSEISSFCVTGRRGTEVNKVYGSSITLCNGTIGPIIMATRITAAFLCPSQCNDLQISAEISLCSITNNQADEERCLTFSYFDNGKMKTINYTNIIDNTGRYTLFVQGVVTLFSCCLLRNNQEQFNAFESDSAIILISSCTDSKEGYGNINITDPVSNFSNSLSFQEIRLCIKKLSYPTHDGNNNNICLIFPYVLLLCEFFSS